MIPSFKVIPRRLCSNLSTRFRRNRMVATSARLVCLSTCRRCFKTDIHHKYLSDSLSCQQQLSVCKQPHLVSTVADALKSIARGRCRCESSHCSRLARRSISSRSTPCNSRLPEINGSWDRHCFSEVTYASMFKTNTPPRDNWHQP